MSNQPNLTADDIKKIVEHMDKLNGSRVVAGSMADIIYHGSDYVDNIAKKMTADLVKSFKQVSTEISAIDGAIRKEVELQGSLNKEIEDLEKLYRRSRSAADKTDLMSQIQIKQDKLNASIRAQVVLEQDMISTQAEADKIHKDINDKEKESLANREKAHKLARKNLELQINSLPIVERELAYERLINEGEQKNADIQAKLMEYDIAKRLHGKLTIEQEADKLSLITQQKANKKEMDGLEDKLRKTQEAHFQVLERTKAGVVEVAGIKAKDAAQDAKNAEDAAKRAETDYQTYLNREKEKFEKLKAQGKIDADLKFEDYIENDNKGRRLKEEAEESRKTADEKQKAAEKLAEFEKSVQAELAGEQKKADDARSARLKDMSEIQRGSKNIGDDALKKQQARLDAAQSKKSAAAESKISAQEALSKIDPNTTDPEELKMIALLEQQVAQADEAMTAADKEAADANMMTSAIKGLQNTMASAFNEMNAAMDNYNQYAAKIDARLQGSDSGYEEVVDLVKSNLALSPIVKTKEVMEKINEAIDHGLTYNLEQRAFLETISEKIADTFDAFDANLMRLIRLQQADSTAARLGMEATLTKLFNEMFEDTSYLTSDGAADSVAGAIIDAQSQMTRDQALEFEFTVQKWLGSLGSLGMGNETLSKIAEGINYLGTGNVEALSSDESLQTLIAMSASEAGLSLADMLVHGLTSDDTNKLLKSMVEYLKEIAEGDNQVVKSAYGGIFSMSQSDMRAISNLTAGDISSISSQNLSYNQAMGETQKQLLMAAIRTPISEQMENIYDNLITTVATGIADNPGTMAAWKINDFIESQTGGINIPFINAMGFGLDLNANINQLIKLGMAGFSLLGQVGTLASSLGNLGGMNLAGWKGEEYTSRGSGFTGISEGVSTGTSQSAYVGNASGDDASDSTLASATEDAQETGEITNAGSEPEHTFDDFYKALLEDKEFVRAEISMPEDSLLNVRLAAINAGILKDEIVTAQLTNEQFNGMLNAIATSLYVGSGGTTSVGSFNTIFNEAYKSFSMLNALEPGVDGSHASGLDTVPFDGYIAEVHKNEAILNAQDASVWRNQSSYSNVLSGGDTSQQISNLGSILDSSISQSSSMLNQSLNSILTEDITTNTNLSDGSELVKALTSDGQLANLLGPDGYLNSSLTNIFEENTAVKEALGPDGVLSNTISETLNRSYVAETEAITNTNTKLEAIYKDFFDSSTAKQVNVSISEKDEGLNRIFNALSEIRTALVGTSAKNNILSAIDNSNHNIEGILNSLGATSEDKKAAISVALVLEKLYELANSPVGFKTYVANDLSGANGGNALDTMAHVLTLGGAL